MIIAPDATYTVAEAGVVLERSERQVLRYLEAGRLRGSRASGRWILTALHIWEFQGIADAMLENWRNYCRLAEQELEIKKNQDLTPSGE
ncbi:hypothetical protein O4G76_17350 [Limimaricola sp. G21655-S1]|uniref:hypothetical protein n=1 Tax=Limimaricola sp. G21655-S1 TaxID=3014768 RepID=UPI0022AF104B|nr:hypothetical protein [Limimaricola sp. G21655-S1]MCZ4262606.1 hypothetical protein [Limimaricola sp. G21655-S1]